MLTRFVRNASLAAALMAVFLIYAVCTARFVNAQYQTQAIFPQQGLVASTSNVQTATATATLGVPQVFGTLVATPGAAATYTTPTAAAICATLGPAGVPNFGWYWDITQGATTFTITVSGGTGVTLTGTGTVASANTRQFKWAVTNCTPGSEALALFSLNTSAR